MEDSNSQVGALVAFAFLVVVSYVVASWLNHSYYFYRRDRFVVLWFSFTIVNLVVVHIPYVLYSLLHGPIYFSDNPFLVMVKDYGRADMRYLRNDSTILASELFAVTVELVFSFLVIRGIVLFAKYRHFMQIVACSTQLFRFWFVLGPEIMSGFSHLDDPFHIIVHIMVGNFLFVLPPALILYESYLDLTTGLMKIITPYRTGSSPRSSKRSLSHLRNRNSWMWHS